MSDRPQDWQQREPMVPRPDPIQGQGAVSDSHAKAAIVDRDYWEMRITAVDEKNIMRVEALAKELSVAMRANAIAIDKAEASVEKRLVGMNEFRQTLTDQASTFATRAALDAFELSVTAKIDAGNESIRAELKGMREALEAKIEANTASGLARQEANRQNNDAKFEAIWKFVYGLGISLATLQAVITFMQNANQGLGK